MFSILRTLGNEMVSNSLRFNLINSSSTWPISWKRWPRFRILLLKLINNDLIYFIFLFSFRQETIDSLSKYSIWIVVNYLLPDATFYLILRDFSPDDFFFQYFNNWLPPRQNPHTKQELINFSWIWCLDIMETNI